MTARILLIDQEPSALAAVVDHLDRAGYAAQIVADCDAARTIIDVDRPDVVVVGRLSGDICRSDYCRDLRSIAPAGQIAIIVAIPVSASRTRIRCLEEGADDVIESPVVAQRLTARISAFLSPERTVGYQSILRYGQLMMSIDELKVRAAGAIIQLSPTGFRLLQTFLEHPEETLSRNDLMKSLGRVGAGSRAIDSQIRRLRQAMAAAGIGHLIVTISSVGYMLSCGVSGF
jgi:two-component system phosphate regulon response regulator PhoB